MATFFARSYGLTKSSGQAARSLVRRFLDIKVDARVVRCAVALISGVIGAVGFTTVSLHRGTKWIDPGVDRLFTVTAVIGLVAGMLIALLSSSERRGRMKRLFAAALVIGTIWVSSATWWQMVVMALVLVAMTAVFPAVVDKLRRALAFVGRRVVTQWGPAAAVIIMMTGGVQAFSGSAALAQESVLPACDADSVSLSIQGEDVDLSAPIGSGRADVVEIPLDDGSGAISFAASTASRQPVVITIELIETWPVDVVDEPILVWHRQVGGATPVDDRLAISRDGWLNTLRIEIDDEFAKIPAFAGVGTFRVRLAASNADVCWAEVAVQVTSGPWDTLLGLAGVSILGLGTAGCASQLIAPRTPSSPPDGKTKQGRRGVSPLKPTLTSIEFRHNGQLVTCGPGEQATLTVGKKYRVGLHVTFPGIAVKDERLDALDGKKIPLRGAHRYLKADLVPTIGVDGTSITAVGSLVALRPCRKRMLELVIAGEPIVVPVEVTPSAGATTGRPRKPRVTPRMTGHRGTKVSRTKATK